MNNTPTTPVTVDTKYGKLYVSVAQADPHSYHDSERGNVTDLRPLVWIASDPGFEADPDAADHWTIRGRAYAVHYHVFFEDRTGIEYANGYKGERWHRDSYTPYRGGFRTDRRAPVEYSTKTYDLMWEAVTEALDAFAEQHPGWDRFSVYLLHAANARREYGKAAEARAEAAKRDAAGDAHAALAGDTLVPAAMLGMINKES